MFCACGVVAGIVGGLLGIGGGFVMGPLFLEMGIHPQVSSGTATFGMLFSSSMSVVEYLSLGSFSCALCSLLHCCDHCCCLHCAIALGGVGITSTIGKIERHEYMGFENLCRYTA
ncbi:hypothetical protein OIU77_005205 [Salix suchowensis]|uniref:Sulfite exporter TauE/SafE family protein n=1 Tax=Salix suchowensis TaxID=1278906 RepID=A0ABQ9AQ50_9ROSI|nr:hypothetical protein OIU77_005205 [Salix suchowensis]